MSISKQHDSRSGFLLFATSSIFILSYHIYHRLSNKLDVKEKKKKKTSMIATGTNGSEPDSAKRKRVRKSRRSLDNGVTSKSTKMTSRLSFEVSFDVVMLSC